MVKLEQFRERVIKLNGFQVYRRIEEQLSSKDYKESDCAGLTAYILGKIPISRDIGTPYFMERVINPILPHALIATGNKKQEISGCIDKANVCMFGNRIMPGHFNFLLGVHDGKIYCFGQVPGEKPEIQEYPNYWYDVFEKDIEKSRRVNFPSEFYQVPVN